MQRTSRATPHVYAATSRALAVSLAINLLLLAVETVAAGSAHSSGLLADVAHAAIDLAADALILVACRLDDLAALAIGALVIRTGVGFIRRGCAQWPALSAWADRSTRGS